MGGTIYRVPAAFKHKKLKLKKFLKKFEKKC